MRILHVLDHSLPLQSGYVFRTLGILANQRARGWETHHMTTPKQTTPYQPCEAVDGWKFYRTPPITEWSERWPVIREIAQMRATTHRLAEVAAEVKPDVIHAHSPVLNAVPAVTVGRWLRIPVVYEVRAFWEDAGVSHGTTTEWGLRYRMTRALETYALRRAGAVTTICEGLRRDIVGRGIAPAKVTVIPNAVDISAFSASGAPDQDLARELGLEGKTVLGFVGSFYRYEGLHVLLDALPGIVEAQPEIRLLLVGGDDEAAELRRQAVALGMSRHVIFTGRVHHSEVVRYYDLIDVLVYPRVNIRLTDLVTPLKPLEAMAQDKIIVASDVGGHHELIADGETGNLFRADDAGSLTKTVLGVLSDQDRWPRQRAQGRRYVETERSWPAVVARYEDVYGSLPAR
jgi:PEP-CTERM/exosortase A-associated glycosyltransferase